MLATFIIFLREGIEATMIVAILLAYLKKIDQRQYFKDVLWGVAAAVVLAVGVGVAVYFTVHQWAGTRAQTIFETITYIVAAAILTYMTLWMHRHARTISSELRSKTDLALTTGERRGFFLLSFQAVGREGIETVVFTLAILMSPAAKGAGWGALAGLAVSGAMSFAIYKLGAKIKLGRFFSVIGALLLVFAVGLVLNAIGNLQELGWLPVLDHPMWNSEGFLNENSAFGDVVHNFFGYTSHPTPLQLVVGVGFLVAAISGIVATRRHQIRQPSTTSSPSPSGGAKVIGAPGKAAISSM